MRKRDGRVDEWEEVRGLAKVDDGEWMVVRAQGREG